MRVDFFLSGNPVHDRVIKALFEGCPEEKRLITDWTYEDPDIAVVFGVYKSKVPLSFPRGEVIRKQRQRNKDVVVLETGYINRGDGENHHYACGLNGLNGRADFKNKNMPDDRLSLLNLKVSPWRASGKHVLLCGQVPWDASVEGTDHIQWLKDTYEALKLATWRPVVYRPHPDIEKPAVPLEAVLDGSWAVVTYNSNSAVDALIKGIPVFAFDEGSMAYSVSNKDLSLISEPRLFDRVQWLSDLAYSQWTPDEMREGKTWAHLFR